MENKPVRNPEIVVRTDAKEALLFDPSTGEMIGVNETGIFIWDLCDGDHTSGDILERMMETFDVSQETAKTDYDSFMKEITETGFIGYKT